MKGGISFPHCRRALYLGRFQPIHNGHVWAIRHALKTCDELVIAVGSAQKSHELHDPFTTGERLQMIRLALKEAKIDSDRVSVIPIPDTWESHSLWVSRVKSYCDSFDTVFSNQPLVARLFKEAGFKVEKFPLYKRNMLSGTQLRKRMIEGGSWEPYLPRSVAKFIRDRKLLERLRELAGNEES